MKLERHPLSALFAQFDLTGSELDNLAADISDHGQQEPIKLCDGLILDGWNRYQACQRANVDPMTVDYKPSDPWAYVVSINIARRHMTASQIAAVYLLKEQMGGVPNGTPHSVRTIQKELGVGHGTAQRISKVASKGTPATKQAVAKGEVSLEKAAKVAALPPAKQAAALAAPPVIETDDEFDPIEELERTQSELVEALKKIEALQTDDLSKTLAKQLEVNAALQSQLNRQMAKAAELDKEVRRYGTQHHALRKILGIEDDRHLLSAVKALKESA